MTGTSFALSIANLLCEAKAESVSWAMAKPFNQNLVRTIRLTREMLALADEGDRDRKDDSCGIVYGVLRDAAYHIRKLAEQECEQHKASGKWDAVERTSNQA